MNILLVEDNIELASLLSLFLQKEGYSVIYTSIGEDALIKMKSNDISLVILDITLPGIDGFEVTKKIRRINNVPIIITSAKSTKEDKLLGLSLGADDYFEKPFDIDILLAKIKSNLRRNNHNEDKIIYSGPIKLDHESRRVYFYDKEVICTIKEYELLDLFIKNKGKILEKEYIFDEIWGMDSYSELSTLTVHINHLRDKFEDDPKNPKRIKTLWGIGYRYEEVE